MADASRPSNDPAGSEKPAGLGTSDASDLDTHVPVARRIDRPKKSRRAFQQPHTLPWVLIGLAALGILVLVGYLRPDLTDAVVVASTAGALFFLVFAFALLAKLGRRAGIVAFVVTGILYGLTAWTPLFVNVRSVLILAVLVAFFLFALAGFNFLFLVEEVLFDIHQKLHIRGTFWNAVPTAVLVGVTPLVYWLLPLVGLRWPTLSIGMPLVILLLIIAWAVYWRVGPHALKIVHEAHFLGVGIIVGAGLADIVTMLHQAEGIVPSILVYLSIIVTWIFVSYTTLQRAHYFIPSDNVLPWMSLLFSSAFAILAHVHFLYGIAGAPGLAAVNDVRINYLEYGVWLGLLFFVIRGVWRFLRFIRDERGLGPGARRTAGQFARIMEMLMQSSERVERGGERVFSALDRVIPGSPQHKRRGRKKDNDRKR